MTQHFRFSCLVVLLGLCAVPPAQAGDHDGSNGGWFSGCGSGGGREVKLDLSQGFNAPEVIRGPVTLILDNVNRLRYETKVGRKLTLEDGPDVFLTQFAFKIPSCSRVTSSPR